MPYLTIKTVDFGTGKAGLTTVGYTVDGTRRTVGVEETTPGKYRALIQFNAGGPLVWDTGEGVPVESATTVSPVDTVLTTQDMAKAVASLLSPVPAITTALPGGLRNTVVPTTPTFPLGIYTLTEPAEIDSSNDARFDLTVAVLSDTDASRFREGETVASRAGNLLVRYFVKGARRMQMAWWWDEKLWVEAGCKRVGSATVRHTYQAYDSRDTWRYEQRLEFRAVAVS